MTSPKSAKFLRLTLSDIEIIDAAIEFANAPARRSAALRRRLGLLRTDSSRELHRAHRWVSACLDLYAKRQEPRHSGSTITLKLSGKTLSTFETNRLSAWLGDVRVVPYLRQTPKKKVLAIADGTMPLSMRGLCAYAVVLISERSHRIQRCVAFDCRRPLFRARVTGGTYRAYCSDECSDKGSGK